ncbi:MAG: S8 family serine peptidase [Anaerolineales bacterium]|nr:S8 family serine peptidase [Anaerolineales bacterium]
MANLVRFGLSLALLSLSAAHPEHVAADEPREWVVRFEGSPPPGVRTNPALLRLGLGVWHAPEAHLAASAADSRILDYWPNTRVSIQIEPDDPYWPNQYGTHNIQIPQSWNMLTGSACLTVTVAVIDTGVDLVHSDLVGRFWHNSGETGAGRETNGVDDDGNGFVDDWQGWDFANGDNDPQDDHGYSHGTHVAGIVAATANNGLGIAGAASLGCPAQIMALKVLRDSGEGTDADVAAAVRYAAEQGARVINLSLGARKETPATEMAIEDAIAQGALVVAAAGNSGQFGVYYPAAYESAVAVAASDSANRRAHFSSYGPQVDLTAPGVGIYSTLRHNYYGTLSGTSMATPHVAAAAALLASQPQFDTPAKIRAALEYTALDLGSICRDPYFGAGLVQTLEALSYDPQAEHPVKCFYYFFPLVGR